MDRYLADLNQKLMGLTHQQIVRWRMKGNFIDEILDINREALTDPAFALSIEEFLNCLNAYEFAMRLLSDEQFHEAYVKMLLNTQYYELKKQSDPQAEEAFVDFHNTYLVPISHCQPLYEMNEYAAGEAFDFAQSAHDFIAKDKEIKLAYEQRESNSEDFLIMMNARLLRVLHATYDS